MDFDAFSGGIEPGGLRNKSDIGVLICYMLDNINAPFDSEDLVAVIQENGLANYFETITAVSELVKCGNIEYADKNNKTLQITQNGRLISAQLYTTISLSVRQKAVGAVMRLMAGKKREQENPVTVSQIEGGGYHVNFRVTDGMRDLMSLTLFVPDISQVNAMRQRFYRNTDKIYSAVLATMIDDKNLLADALKDMTT